MKDNGSRKSSAQFSKLLQIAKTALSAVEKALQEKSDRAALEAIQEEMDVRLTLVFKGLKFEKSNNRVDRVSISWLDKVIPVKLSAQIQKELLRDDKFTGLASIDDCQLIVNATDLSIETSIKESEELWPKN